MRRLVKLALIALGIRALLRLRKRRRAEATGVPAATPAAAPADPADDLRQKLAESRVDDLAAEETVVPEATVQDRRSEVHEQARATLDEMNPADEA